MAKASILFIAVNVASLFSLDKMKGVDERKISLYEINSLIFSNL